jgi:hypothetical protein
VNLTFPCLCSNQTLIKYFFQFRITNREQMPFSNDHQITIEKTPKYFVDKNVPRRVKRMNPHIKLIVVLRDPVERTISEYVQSKQNRVKKRQLTHRRLTRSLRNFNDSSILRQLIYDQKGQLMLDKPMLRNSIYANHLKNWLKFFPLEQFMFVNGDRLVKAPSVELERLEAFLNLEHVIKEEHFFFNEQKGFPCIYKPLGSNNVKCLNDQKGRKHPQIDRTILEDLSELYRPFNKEFFELIGQDPWW